MFGGWTDSGHAAVSHYLPSDNLTTTPSGRGTSVKALLCPNKTLPEITFLIQLQLQSQALVGLENNWREVRLAAYNQCQDIDLKSIKSEETTITGKVPKSDRSAISVLNKITSK